MKTRSIIKLAGLALAVTAFGISGLVQAKQPEPYRIAVLVSLTGPLAALGVPSKAALDLAAKKANDAGGVNGHPIELIYGDDQSDPSKGLLAFKRLLDEKPVALIGPNFSSTALGIIPLVERAKLPMISMAAEDTQVAPGRPHVFMVSLTTRLNAAADLSYLEATGVRNIAVIYDSGAYGRGGLRILTELAPAAGITIVQSEAFNLSGTEMTSQLTKIRNNANVQAIVMWGAGGAPSVVVREFHALNFRIPMIVTGAQGGSDFPKSAGPAADGLPFPACRSLLYSYLPANNDSRKQFEEFLASYRKATDGLSPNIFASVAHDAFSLMYSAIRTAGSGDADKIVRALEATKFVGVNGEYAFSADAHSGMLPSSIAMGAWKEGKLVPVKPNCNGCFATVE